MTTAPRADRIAELAAAIRSMEHGGGDPTLVSRPRVETVRPTVERQAIPDDREAEQRARSIVVRKLTSRARSRAELVDALGAAGIPGHIAELVLDRMAEVGLVDDDAFAQQWVESRQRRRHLSRRKLADELQRKGVAPSTVAEAVAEVTEGDEHSAALELARRKAPTLARHDAVTQRRRLAGLLDRRGFSTDVVQRVLREVLESDPPRGNC